MNYTSDSLTALTLCVLQGFGCNDEEAHLVADHLVLANLSGHDSHGVGMLPTYGAQVRDGNMVPNQTPDMQAQIGAISVVDAKRGFGHRMAIMALDYAMQTMADHKVAVLGMRNSSHVSRVGTYTEYCATQGYASIHAVNAVGHRPMVASFGSREAALGTNPISMGMPVNNEAKPMLDMATSTVAFGKVRVANNKGVEVPDDCLIDSAGNPTTNPKPMAEEGAGALSSFGKHKGSGLGVMVEMLTGALASNLNIDELDYMPNGVINNMFSVIIDPAAFGDAASVQSSTEQIYAYLKGKAPVADLDEVLMPGEPEKISRQQRRANGVPVDDATIKQIIATGESWGIAAGELESMLISA